MSCGNLNIVNENTTVVTVPENNTITITDLNSCNVVTAIQQITETVQINVPGPRGLQGPIGPSGSAAGAGGLDTSIQFNSGSKFSGSSNFIFDYTNNKVVLTGSMDITGSLTVNTVNVGQNTLNFIDNAGIILNSISVDNSANVILTSGSFEATSFSGSFTGSLQGTSSLATSASYALSASYLIGGIDFSTLVTTASFNAFTSSYNTGSFTGSFVGILEGTASWANNYKETDPIFVAKSASLATTGSNIFVGNQTVSGSITFDGGASISGSDNFDIIVNSRQWTFGNDGYLVLPQVDSLTDQAAIKSAGDIIIAADEIQSWRFVSGSGVLQAPGGIEAPSFTGSLQGTSSWAENYTESDPIYTAEKGKYLTTGSYNTTQIISGSLVIDQNLTVLGSQSIQYITSSQLNIGTNLIIVNTATPAIRFGGLAVYDSGSTGTGRTGSILWDSQNDVWVYSNPSGAAYDGGMLLTGPRNTSGIGNEVGISTWYAAIGNGSHHMTSSQIWNSGSLIRLETNTQVTGSLTVSSNIFGTASWAESASNAVNALTASFAPDYVLITTTSSMLEPYVLTNVTGSMLAPYVLTSQTSSMSVATASYALNAAPLENLSIAYAIALG